MKDDTIKAIREIARIEKNILFIVIFLEIFKERDLIDIIYIGSFLKEKS